jgi:DNA-binding NarL/FixJ family response regulator
MASVLIVDDDPTFRELATRVLTAAGMRVVSQADSVATARAEAEAVRPDAVLVDVMLPDGDGVALALELAALPWAPRVLITSSNPDAASRAEIGRSRAVGFVPKYELPNAPLERLLAEPA